MVRQRERRRRLNTAQRWTGTNTETIIGEVVGLMTRDVPGVSRFSTVKATQIANLLSWECSEPVKTTEGIYRVTATVFNPSIAGPAAIGFKDLRSHATLRPAGGHEHRLGRPVVGSPQRCGGG